MLIRSLAGCLLAFVAVADEGSISIDGLEAGDLQCALTANRQASAHYSNWIASNEGEDFPLERAKPHYMEFNQGLPTDEALNRIIGEHVERVYAGEYDSVESSVEDFYTRCLDSEFRDIVDEDFAS